MNGETFPRSTNKESDARFDIHAHGFWDSGNGQNDAFFDVRVFHPCAPSYRNQSLTAVYRQHEAKKRLEYAKRVLEVERGSFTPLVFTTGGGMGKETTVAMKRLSHLLSLKREEPYSVIMGWLRCAISFCLLRSALACLRGSRQHKGLSLDINTIPEATAEGRTYF